ncbi:MAG TPA: DUF1963 domain-containing protein [Burkholderiales bacterium]|nr:DUF1963 domain-containing protein [Burkholderiales bacterium]
MTDKPEALAARYGFDAQADVLRKYLLPCLGFSVGSPSDCPVGSSRFGGGPDIPASVAWPSSKDRPLDFLLQINLRDVVPHDTASRFPRAGLLSFFYDLSKQPWGFGPEDLDGHRIVFFPDDTKLERRAAADTDFPLTQAPPNAGSRIVW